VHAICGAPGVLTTAHLGSSGATPRSCRLRERRSRRRGGCERRDRRRSQLRSIHPASGEVEDRSGGRALLLNRSSRRDAGDSSSPRSQSTTASVTRRSHRCGEPLLHQPRAHTARTAHPLAFRSLAHNDVARDRQMWRRPASPTGAQRRWPPPCRCRCNAGSADFEHATGGRPANMSTCLTMIFPRSERQRRGRSLRSVSPGWRTSRTGASPNCSASTALDRERSGS
jgi:hypothetical protein